MTARKTRPMFGDALTAEMSHRDQAAAIGISSAELWRWKRLGAMSATAFEQAIADVRAAEGFCGIITATALLEVGKPPVPARGRVQRAFTLYAGMTPEERGEFLARIGLGSRKYTEREE